MQSLKLLVFRIAFHLGIFVVFDFLNKKALRIYSYHGVVLDGERKISGMDFQVDVLRDQLTLLSSRYGCERLDELLRNQSGSVAITFDDGCMSDFTRAKPVLDDLGIKGTFFIVTELAAGKKFLTWTDLSVLSGIAQLARPGPLNTGDLAIARKYALSFEQKIRNGCVKNPYDLLGESGTKQLQDNLQKIAQDIDSDRFSAMGPTELSALVKSGHSIGCHSSSHPILRYLEHDASALGSVNK